MVWKTYNTIIPTIQKQFRKNKRALHVTGEKSCPPQHKKVLFLPNSDFFVEFLSFGDSEQGIRKRV